MFRDNIEDKNYLRRGVNITVNTIMIGALQAFEEVFGDLWGHGKKPDELTEDEEMYRNLWLEARERILNNGNNSRSIIMETLNSFSVKRKNFFGKVQE